MDPRQQAGPSRPEPTSGRGTGRGERILVVYVYLQTLLTAIYLAFTLRHFYQDDSFISLRYARNLIAGDGLSWNPGERIEGYSNFAFVMVVALLGRLGLDLVFASRLVGVAAALALVVILLRYFQATWQPRHQAVGGSDRRLLEAVLVCLLVSSVPLVAWSLGGLEATLFALFLLLGLTHILRLIESDDDARGWWAGIWFALAALTRPEGGLFWAVALVFLAASERKQGKTLLDLGGTQRLAGAFIAIAGPYGLWKLWYFGELLPNTYFAKSYGLPLSFKAAEGAAYVIAYTTTAPCLVLFVGLALLLERGRGGGRVTGLLMTITAAFLTLQILVGGDFMDHFRFFVPLVPILALASVWILRELAASERGRMARPLIILPVLLSLVPLPLVESHPGSSSDIVGRVAAPYISECWPPDSLIGINASGALPYLLPQYRYIDMLGLNDRHIARRKMPSPQGAVGHNKGDGEYVLARKPDYLLLGFPYGDAVTEPEFPGDKEILASPTLLEHYEKRVVDLEVPADLRSRLDAVGDRYPVRRAAQGRLRFTYWARRGGAVCPGEGEVSSKQ